MPTDPPSVISNALNIILLLVFFQLQTQISFCQDNLRLDTLLQTLEAQSGTDYIDQLVEIANLQTKEEKLETYQQILQKAKAINYTKILAEINFRLGLHYGSKAEVEKSIQHFDTAIDYAKERNDWAFEVKNICKKSYQLTMSGKTEEAFELLMIALHRSEKENTDPKTIAEIHLELGDFHRLQHDVDKAIFHLNKALAYFEKQDDLMQQAKIIFNIGNTYKIGGTDALNQKGIEAMKKLLEAPYVEVLPEFIIPRVQTSLGGMLRYAEEYEKAEKILLSSLALKEARKDTTSMVYSYNELASLYTNWGQAQKSIFYGEKILEIMSKKDDIFSVSDSYRNLSEAYAGIHNYPKAYAYLKKMEEMRDSVVNQEKAIALAEMETKYKTDIQNEKLARQDLMISQQKYTTAFIIGGLLLLGLIAFLWLQTQLRFKVKETKQLEALNASKTRFLTNISHELRTPLTLLVNPLRQLQSLPKSNGTNVLISQPEINRMVRNGERLERLIKQITDLSRFEEANYQLKASQQDLVEFASNIVDSFKQIAEEQKKELSFFSTEKSLMVYFDTEKMEAILLNLLYNAFKFTKKEDTVKVLLTTHDGMAQIQIQDSGIGITEDQQAFIFDRFYQSNDRDTRQHEGIGIGLSLVEEMVKLHHGSIRVESTLGEKTNFILTFLLDKDHFSQNELIAHPDWQAQKIQLLGNHYRKPNIVSTRKGTANAQPVILVVEDNLDLLNYIEEQLKTGYEVITAQNGEEGLKKSIEHIPELILSDVMMPEMDGFEFCEKIKSDHRTSHIPIILLTAKADVENIKIGLKHGADAYITKPFDQSLLNAKISNLIAQRQKLRVLFSEKLVIKPSDIKVNSKEDQFLVELLELVEQNISNPNFGPEELSKAIGFSRSQFYRKLKALTDQSPAVFIRSIRLDRAKQLLEQSAGNASEIAYMVGFNNPNYFFKCFKDQFGMTPKDVISKMNKIQEK